MITGDYYKHINPEYINEMADGDNDFILQIIDIYLANIPQNIIQIQEAAAGTDYAAITFCTHKLRGSFNFIGGKELVLTLDKIDELCIAQTDLPGIRLLVKTVVAITDEILKELNDIQEQVSNSMH